jgi:transcriptional regulator with XRE-family HTH domain
MPKMLKKRSSDANLLQIIVLLKLKSLICNNKQLETRAMLGVNIKRFRKSFNVTQSELAEYIGIPREILSYYENGKREVSLLHLEKISAYLNVDMSEFFEENFERIKPELELTFRANDVSAGDREKIVEFKKIVKNYQKMKTIEAHGIQT